MTVGADITESAEQSVEPGAAGPSLPGVPRPVTARVRQRVWAEPHVRFWWVLALALLLITVYVAGREWRTWSREVRLIRSGRVVDAEITSAGGLSSPWQQLPPDSVVSIRYDVGGKVFEKSGYLHGRTEFIRPRSKVPIRIDPADPGQWTARTEPASLTQQLTGAMVALPVFAAVLVVSFVHRARTLRLWREGEARRAIVVDSRQTALAPRSRLVRCTPADAGDNRVVQVYVTGDAAAALQSGDEAWLLFPPGGRGRPVAAAWFE